MHQGLNSLKLRVLYTVPPVRHRTPKQPQLIQYSSVQFIQFNLDQAKFTPSFNKKESLIVLVGRRLNAYMPLPEIFKLCVYTNCIVLHVGWQKFFIRMRKWWFVNGQNHRYISCTKLFACKEIIKKLRTTIKSFTYQHFSSAKQSFNSPSVFDCLVYLDYTANSQGNNWSSFQLLNQQIGLGTN